MFYHGFGTGKKLFYESDISFDKSNWHHVLSASMGKVLASQQACSTQVVKGQNWAVDFYDGTIKFGDTPYPIQFIGSESSESNTWLWGWENINGFSDDLLITAKAMKKLGVYWDLFLFSTPTFELNDSYMGHNVATIVCALSKENICYYKGPHAKGAVFIAFSNLPEAVFAPVDAITFISLSVDCIQQPFIDHRIFVESFLFQNHTPYKWIDHTIVASFDEIVKITFEEVNEKLLISNLQII